MLFNRVLKHGREAILRVNSENCKVTFKKVTGMFLGATRDIGACLTRVCMRQRSIENRLRSFVDSLTDEFAMKLQNKGTHWKQRTVEMDRHAHKFCRKVNFEVLNSLEILNLAVQDKSFLWLIK